MKVLLISANTELINMPVLPLGLACIASATQQAGHDIAVLNLMCRKDVTHVIEASIKDFKPEVIGISVRNIDDQQLVSPKFLLEPVKSVVSFCRELSDCPIIIGGAGYSIFPLSALEYLGADMGIQGQGEHAFISLLERLKKGESVSKVPGLYLPGKGLQRKINYKFSLNHFPLPLPGEHLAVPANLKDQEIWLPFQFRRGCPMRCTYCSTPIIEGPILHRRNLERAVDSVSHYAASGFNRFFFVDNVFNFPLSYAKELCERLIAKKINIKWRCILYPWKVDEDLIKKMALAGCEEVSLGFESGSDRIIKNMNKRYTTDEVRHIVDLLKKYHIYTMGFLLLGGPGEDKDTITESLIFADSLDIDSVKITIGIRIYPYTPLARQVVKDCMVKAGDNLLFPKFYITDDLKMWTIETVKGWIDGRQNWHL